MERIHRRGRLPIFALLPLFVLGLLVNTISTASAQQYPVRPIHIICSWGTGGGSDMLTRKTSTLLEPLVDVNCPVSNVPGGGGSAGLAKMMAKPADGYTIANYIASTHTLTMQDKIKYSMGEDFIPLARMEVMNNWLFVNPEKVDWENGEEMINYIRANPNEVTCAGEAADAPAAYMVEQMANQDNIKMKGAWYSKPGERYASVVGGHNEVLYEQMGDVIDYVEAGKLKPILHLNNERSERFPDVQCTAEIGLEGYSKYVQWRGYVIKADTPEKKVDYLSDKLKEIATSKEWKDFLKKFYMNPKKSYMGPKEFEKFLRGPAKYWE